MPGGAHSPPDTKILRRMRQREKIMRKIVPTDKARQGRWGTQVLVVLVAALILAAGAWTIAEFYGEATEPQNPGQAEQVEPSTPRPSG
jgi:hypothetical protein